MNECNPIPEEVCTQNVVTECKTIEKEECTEASQTCNMRTLLEKQVVKNNCEVKDRVCEYKEDTKCEVTMEPVEKWVPKKVCKDVCEPIHLTNECAPKTTRQSCKNITKKMFYKVPVEKC